MLVITEDAAVNLAGKALYSVSESGDQPNDMNLVHLHGSAYRS